MLTTREFKIAKLNRARAAQMYSVRNRVRNLMVAAQFVDQFIVAVSAFSAIFAAMVFHSLVFRRFRRS